MVIIILSFTPNQSLELHITKYSLTNVVTYLQGNKAPSSEGRQSQPQQAHSDSVSHYSHSVKVHPSLASLGTWKKFTESTEIFSNRLKLTFFLFSCVILFVFEVDSALPLDTHYKSSQIGGKRLLLSIAMVAINILNKIVLPFGRKSSIQR